MSLLLAGFKKEEDVGDLLTFTNNQEVITIHNGSIFYEDKTSRRTLTGRYGQKQEHTYQCRLFDTYSDLLDFLDGSIL